MDRSKDMGRDDNIISYQDDEEKHEEEMIDHNDKSQCQENQKTMN